MEVRIEKVSGASKYEQKVTRAPASVTIVTAEEIEKFGHRTLAEVLRSVRGVYVTSDRNYANLGVRGFGRPGDFNTRSLLLVDGHRMNDNLYGSALIGAEGMLDVDLIERVEVVRGPSSSIYGNSAFFGVLNVTSRKARDIDGLEIAAESGSLGTRRGRVTYGRQFANELELILSAAASDSDGNSRLYYPEFDTPDQNGGVAENSDAERTRNFHARTAWRGFTLAAGYSRREKQVPTASFGTVFNDGREVTIDERAFADLKFERDFDGDLAFATHAFYDRYNYLSTYPYNYAAPGAPPFIVLSHDDNRGAGAGADFQFTKKFLKHTIVAGGEYRRDLSLRQSNYNDNPKTYNSFSDESGDSVGFYVQDEIVLRPNLLLNAGLRHDSFSNFGSTLNPRVAVILNPTAKSTLKLLYGEAYRAPNAYESYLVSPGFAKANLKLKPETIRTIEGVYEHYLPLNLRLSVSAYHYTIDQLLSQQFDPTDGLFAFQNASKTDANGAEVELEGRYARGILLRASYAEQRATDQSSGKELDNSPRHLGKLNLILPLYRETVYAGLEGQYLSGLKTITGTRTTDFTVVNLTLFAGTPVEGLSLSASIYNLFDRAYAYPGSTGHVQNTIPQDGRSLRVKLTYRF